MTEGDAEQRTRRLVGVISCFVGMLLGGVQVLAAFAGAGANATAGVLGIAFCILGYYLDARKPATATIFLCVASVLFGLAASQGLIPGIEPSDRAFPRF